MLKISGDPKNKKRIRQWAILWTLLIFFLCFIPPQTIPKVDVPLIDKWTHFILFGVFAYLWLLSLVHFSVKYLFIVFIAAALLGWMVELIQGSLGFLGRSQENMDTLADAIGGLMGVVVFYVVYSIRKRKLNSGNDLQK